MATSRRSKDSCLRELQSTYKAGASADGEHTNYGTLLEYAVWMNHRRLWPFFFRLGAAHPRPPESMPKPNITGSWYAPHRAHPYFGKIEAAGGWKKYECRHRKQLTTTFARVVFPRLPIEAISNIVCFWAHVGFYAVA